MSKTVMAMHKIKICALSLLALLCCCKFTVSQSTPSLSVNTRRPNFRHGTDGSIECHLEGATMEQAMGQFEWTGPAINTENVESRRVTIEQPSGTFSILRFVPAYGDDAGSYTCRHSAVPGNGIQITVSVQRDPVFIPTQENSYSVHEGGDIVMSCQVMYCGQSCLNGLHWSRNTRSIPSNKTTTGDITTLTTTLSNVQQEDSGTYKCIISLNVDQDFTLTVLPQLDGVPLLDKSSDNQYQEFYYDQALVLTCPVRSGVNSTQNPMTISWVFTNIHQQDQFVTGPVLTLIPGCFNRGEYKCTASNNFGADSLSIFVEINAPPLPALVTLPTLTITNESPRETLVFTPPTSPVAISSLMYRWEKLEDEQWTPLSYNSGKYTKTHSGHLVINDISFMDAGSYRVIISNDYGSSIQTRQVEVSPKPTPGEPVHIGFTFTLPNSISCIEVKASRDLLTEHLNSYLSTLCLNTTSESMGCADIAVQDVSVECPGTSHQGTVSAQMKSSSHAKRTASVFETNGPTRLNKHIRIEPCGEGQCVLPTEAIESLRDLVAVLVIVVMVLVIVVIVTIIIVICVLKHKSSTKNQVADAESNTKTLRRSINQVQRSISSPATLNDYVTMPMNSVTPHDTLGQVTQQTHHYYNC